MDTVSKRIRSACLDVGLSLKAANAVALLVAGYLLKERRQYTRKSLPPERYDTRMDSIVAERLDWNAPPSEWVWRTSNETLVMLGIDDASRSDQSVFAIALRRHGATSTRRNNGRNLRLVPPMI